MRSRTRISTLAAATLAATCALAPSAGAAKELPPRAATGAATHVLTSSALLTATIDPEGIETTYYFEWGLTTSYGHTSAPVSAGGAKMRIRVGQAITGLQAGATYHYRVVAVNANKRVALGHDDFFKARGAKLSFIVSKTVQDTYGTPLILTGSLSGFGAGAHRIALQASPFPYLEPFATVGAPGLTNAAGAFSFRVANLLTDTELRVTTLDLLPVYSPTITVTVVPRASLHVRSSATRGIVRLYGTIAPAVNGAKVSFQVLKAVRPGKSEATVRWVTQFSTVAKRNNASSSRFSVVATVRHGGRYRVFVKPPRGKLAAGASSTTVVLHAAASGKH
ncbi:MAG TPA: hypothetical protein VHT27_07500 [Solirubrobacteraceae bacterium]|nr:hypothetical protein [Solirubrobacteraceae bacterium]